MNWEKLTLAEQLGNIASEISRAKHWASIGDLESRNRALERALELLDLTTKVNQKRRPLKELTRLREVICALIFAPDLYNISYEQLIDYLLPFAMLARRSRDYDLKRV